MRRSKHRFSLPALAVIAVMVFALVPHFNVSADPNADTTPTQEQKVETEMPTLSSTDSCTRGEFFTMLWQCNGSPEEGTTENITLFTDLPQNSYYTKAALWAYNKKITGGMTNSTFGVDSGLTRAQAITFIYRCEGSPASTITEDPFTDVGEFDFYYSAVAWAYENGIIDTESKTFYPDRTCTAGQAVAFLKKAYPDTSSGLQGIANSTVTPDATPTPAPDKEQPVFSADNTASCTRGQFFTLLWECDGSKDVSLEDCPFTDVNKESYYAKAVTWAYKNHITSGIVETIFSPDSNINRAQAVTFLYYYAGSPAITLETIPYGDVPDNAYYTKPSMWAYEKELVDAQAKNFEPDAVCTIGDAVTFVQKMGKTIPEPTKEPTPTPEPTTHSVPSTPSAPVVTPAVTPAASVVTVPQKTENGSVVISTTSAKAGDTVKITTKPAKGCIVKSVTVKDKDGKEVAVTGENGEYAFTMPDGTVDVEPVFMDVSDKFTDVATTNFSHDSVAWAVNNGITAGTADNSFSPDDSCTRAQMITFLWRAAGSPKAKNMSAAFSDVKDNVFYYDAIQWAVENGITNGTTPTTFSPDETVTRAQVAAFLYHLNGAPKVSDSTSFNDVESGAWYADAVAWMAENKITTGTTETTYSPDADCTRGQAVTFLYNTQK